MLAAHVRLPQTTMSHTSAWFQLLVLFLLSGALTPETTKLVLARGTNGSSSCSEVERAALLKLKQGLTDPQDHLSSWVGQDCCAWGGVGCSNRTKRVLRLDLHQLSLGGDIGASILDLKDLSYLDLSMNNFGSTTIPNFIGSLSNLRYLNLSGSSFGGTIPKGLGKLSQVRFLDLSNSFSESSPNDLLWLSGLSSLQYLNLQAVDLSKAAYYWLQTVNLLPSLRELHLSNCDLLDLPSSLPFINFTSLSFLDLSNNGFNSSLPIWLFNLTSLEYINLKSNNIQGVLPDSFSSLASLQRLDLSQNSFIQGPLPRTLGTLCNLRSLELSANQMGGTTDEFFNTLAQCKNGSNLEYLDLSYNEFTGILPESLGGLKKFMLLRLDRNLFTGSIPESIGNLSSLEQFYVPENYLSRISTSIGHLSALNALDLSENDWEGVITEDHFANLSSLRDLNLYKESPNISLTFNISHNWLPPFRLEYIRIRSCLLGPAFPNWLRNQIELSTVVLNNVQIEDTIPKWFIDMNLLLSEIDVAYNKLSGIPPTTLVFSSYANVDLSSNLYEGDLPLWSSNVTTLYLRDNRFSGLIPPDIGDKMPLLTDLDISQNSLTGEIPLSIGNCPTLTTLVISDNYLTGEIPRFWDQTPFLYILDMSNNSLSGPIPTEIGYLASLRFFIVSNNNLSGELPASLGNCSFINSLDLGENRFSGKIPGWIAEKMETLLILRLRNNSFVGEIPTQICGLSGLHIVDLSHNRLTGAIPSCVGNLAGLMVELTQQDTQEYQGRLTVVSKGRFLQYSNTLYLVNSLDLSDNELSRGIPRELMNLVKLGTLNLSMNNLVGKIPDEISNLEVLETLDLSWNNFTGSIPPRMVSMTKLNHLDLSYNNFSGRIPTANQFLTFSSSDFEGNPELCGKPLLRRCDGEDDQPQSPSAGKGDNGNGWSEDGDDDGLEKLWFFLTIGFGFFVGFWGVCGTLVLKKSWRVAYFRLADEIMDNVMVAVSLRIAKLRTSAAHEDERTTPVRVEVTESNLQTVVAP